MKKFIAPLLVAFWVACLASPAFALFPFPTVSSGGLASAGYNPAGVVLHQDTFLGVVNGPLGVTNTKQHTLSFWMNGSRSALSLTSYINVTAVGSNPNTQCELIGTGFSPGLCLSFDNSAYGLQASFNNSVGVTGTTDSITFYGLSNTWLLPFNGSWHHYLISFDTSTASNWAVYVDGVKASFGARWVANLVPDFNHAAGWRWGNGSESPNVYDWWAEIYESNQTVLCTGTGSQMVGGIVVPCAGGTGTIDPLILQKFIKGGLPVNMGSSCQIPTGTSAQICLTGSGTDMATNKGTATNPIGVYTYRSSSNYITGLPSASSFTAGVTTSITMGGSAPSGVIAGWTVFDSTQHYNVGTVASYTGTTLTLTSPAAITSAGSTDNLIFYGPQTLPLPPAPYGPAGFTRRTATLRWVSYQTITVASLPTVSNNMPVTNNGNPISIGDVLVLIGEWENSSTNPPVGYCPTGWTQGGIATIANDQSAVMCWQLQTSAVASNGVASIANITASAASTRNASWMLLDYGATLGVNTVDTAASGCQATSASTSIPTPTNTTNHATDTLVSIAIGDYSANKSAFTVPASSSLHFYSPLGTGNNSWWGIADQYLNNIGPTTRTWTLTTAGSSIGCDIAIYPN